eukprot:417548-Rhodomonas_salina.1
MHKSVADIHERRAGAGAGRGHHSNTRVCAGWYLRVCCAEAAGCSPSTSPGAISGTPQFGPIWIFPTNIWRLRICNSGVSKMAPEILSYLRGSGHVVWQLQSRWESQTIQTLAAVSEIGFATSEIEGETSRPSE